MAARNTGLRILVRGAVQGVGFRPFVYRLAHRLALVGWVLNGGDGVTIEVEGNVTQLEAFLQQLQAAPPPRAHIIQIETTWHAPHGYTGFQIRPSQPHGRPTTLIAPDTATCPDCLAEIRDPANRRFGYAFTNCTNCGPRFSIMTALPYDRPNTTMRSFRLCPACGAEYGDPVDRRFHAQPNACPVCGPRLAFNVAGEAASPATDDPLNAAAAALRQGQILALKGIGGYQLLVDPRNAEAVARLRIRKARPAKPLALMARDLEQAAALVQIDPLAADLLTSAEAPIVLLPRTTQPRIPIADAVAPGSPYLGVMLPCSPLHHLLLHRLDVPLVATSGNLRDEPICIHEAEAHQRLGQIADAFLTHNRPIERHVDDSVVQVIAATPRIIRRARGYAPLPVALPATPPSTLALGGHLKNTIALSLGQQVFISQHIGDLSTLEARSAFERVIQDFLRLYPTQPALVAHDLHPDYVSSQVAHTTLIPDVPRIAIQHHHAHFAACLAEHGVLEPALGVIWDGTGYGVDGTIWGGEFLLGQLHASQRIGHLRPFRLPGGEAAVREPARVALALLWETLGPAGVECADLAPLDTFNPTQRNLLLRMLQQGLNSPRTSSAGRLFDGVAALLGLFPQVSFEGQAAIALEYLADPYEQSAYPLVWDRGEAQPHTAGRVTCPPNPFVLDWRPAISAILDDLRQGVARERIAARFHNGVISAICALARQVGVHTVALSGGCFQNRYLAEGAINQLQIAHQRPLLPRQIPVNDGGLSYGQVATMISTIN
ncbi:carbamoyltransferase HypF [Candidatus Oscillochloris fontis]|uniref:carbamoyltransferase HypF n=1 Tax=Candidatus Oscillochloris fontis TaxID=2496868 RepID=UPI00101C6864|nr:carbamoyltransferase HypF [Candidatus Oscillochloris fontis]